MVESAAVILFIFCRANEDMVIPFVAEIPDVADRDVNAFVFRAFDKSRKAVVVFIDVDELPMVIAAYRLEIVYVFGLKGLVIVAGVAARGKFVREIFL